jgi:hypothetical protein
MSKNKLIFHVACIGKKEKKCTTHESIVALWWNQKKLNMSWIIQKTVIKTHKSHTRETHVCVNKKSDPTRGEPVVLSGNLRTIWKMKKDWINKNPRLFGVLETLFLRQLEDGEANAVDSDASTMLPDFISGELRSMLLCNSPLGERKKNLYKNNMGTRNHKLYTWHDSHVIYTEYLLQSMCTILSTLLYSSQRTFYNPVSRQSTKNVCTIWVKVKIPDGDVINRHKRPKVESVVGNTNKIPGSTSTHNHKVFHSCSHILPASSRGTGPTCGYCKFRDSHGVHGFHGKSMELERKKTALLDNSNVTYHGLKTTLTLMTKWNPCTITAEKHHRSFITSILKKYQNKKHRSSKVIVQPMADTASDYGVTPRVLRLASCRELQQETLDSMMQSIFSLWHVFVTRFSKEMAKLSYSFPLHVIVCVYHSIYGVFFVEKTPGILDTNGSAKKHSHQGDKVVGKRKRVDKRKNTDTDFCSIDASCVFNQQNYFHPRVAVLVEILPAIPLLSECLPYVSHLQSFGYSLGSIGDAHVVFRLFLFSCTRDAFNSFDNKSFKTLKRDLFTFAPNTLFL